MHSKDYADGNAPKHTGIGDTGRYLIDCTVQAAHYLCLCFKIKQERRNLAKLTQKELQDIGLHPADVQAECRRSFLDVPADRWQQRLETKKSKVLRNQTSMPFGNTS